MEGKMLTMVLIRLWPSGGVYSSPVVARGANRCSALAALDRIRARITAKAVVHM